MHRLLVPKKTGQKSVEPGAQSTPPMISASSPRWRGGAEDGDKQEAAWGLDRLPGHCVVVYLTVYLHQSFFHKRPGRLPHLFDRRLSHLLTDAVEKDLQGASSQDCVVALALESMLLRNSIV